MSSRASRKRFGPASSARSPRSTTRISGSAPLAIAYVSADAHHANEVVTKALDFIENTVEGEVLETFVEIL
jgi:uncharacterized protein YlxP (DUF503 family)